MTKLFLRINAAGPDGHGLPPTTHDASDHSLAGAREPRAYTAYTDPSGAFTVGVWACDAGTHQTSAEALRIVVESGVDMAQHCAHTGRSRIAEATIQLMITRKFYCGTQWGLLTKEQLQQVREQRFPGSDQDNGREGVDHSVENAVRLIKAGIPELVSTDAGTIDPDVSKDFGPDGGPGGLGGHASLIGEAEFEDMRAMEQRGMTPMMILQAATRTIAAAYHKLDAFGTLEAGKSADLIVVDADPLLTGGARFFKQDFSTVSYSALPYCGSYCGTGILGVTDVTGGYSTTGTVCESHDARHAAARMVAGAAAVRCAGLGPVQAIQEGLERLGVRPIARRHRGEAHEGLVALRQQPAHLPGGLPNRGVMLGEESDVATGENEQSERLDGKSDHALAHGGIRLLQVAVDGVALLDVLTADEIAGRDLAVRHVEQGMALAAVQMIDLVEQVRVGQPRDFVHDGRDPDVQPPVEDAPLDFVGREDVEPLIDVGSEA
jgi:hypothetical protein